MQRKPARSLPGGLCNLHKAEDIHADSWGPQSLAALLPLLTPANAASAAPWSGPQCAWGLSGGSGWWRRPRRASTWRRRLLPPSGRELRVHPQAGPLMGARFGKTQWRGSQAGRKQRGRRARPGSCAPPQELWPRGPPGAQRTRGQGEGLRSCFPVSHAPHRRSQTEPGGGGQAWHRRTHPSQYCSCLPASFPKPSPFLFSLPPLDQGEGALPCHPLRSLQILQICSNSP